MKHLEDLKEVVKRELEKFGKQGDISVNSLDKIHKLSDLYKNLCKIEMIETEEEGGYSEAGNWMGEGRMYGNSYARGRGRNAKRDSMGRYSREDGYSEEGGSYRGLSYDDDMSYARGGMRGGRGGYSRDEGKDEMMSMLGEMMEDANPKERQALKECMRALEKA